MIKFTICLFVMLASLACKRTTSKYTDVQKLAPVPPPPDSIGPSPAILPLQNITVPKLDTVIKAVTSHELVAYAQTLQGIP